MATLQEPPGRIGPYEPIRRIAQGGMAEVWLARRPGFGGADKPCALKLPLPHLRGDPRFRRMFVAEARVAMRLSHGNVVSTFDVGEDGDLLYMAMDWIDGVDLAALAEAWREAGLELSPAIAAHIVGELLAALDYAHTFSIGGRPEGIVHRDVSPHNVLVSAAGEVLLTDFGIARIVHEQTSQEHAKGKLRYMAAEHLRGQATPRSDLYAVGAILHELLEGRKFRDGVSGEAFFGHILDGVVPESTRRDVPPEIEAVRRGLLEPDAQRRIATAELAMTMLARWPGHRNERVALRRLVRSHRGHAERVSGLTELVPLHEPSTRSASRIAVVTPAPPDEGQPTSGGTAVVSRERPPTGTWSDAPTTRTHVEHRSRTTFIAALLTALLTPPAIALTTLHACTPPTPTDRPTTNAATTKPAPVPAPVDVPAPAPVFAPVDAPVPAPVDVPVPDDVADADADDVADADADDVADADADAVPVAESAPVSPPKKPKPVRVTVLLEFIDWAEIDLDGTRTVVTPRARLTVPPGPHRIRWRTNPSDPFRTAPRHTLAPHRDHQLRVRADELRWRALPRTGKR